MKTEMVKVRVTPDEKKTFSIAADLAGVPMSAWMRERMRREARRELEDAGIEIPFLAAIRME